MVDNTPISEQDLIDALAKSAEALAQHRVTYALIGGMAAGYRSQPRFTKDLDFLLLVPQLVLPKVLDALANYGFQFDMQTTIGEWTQYHMAVLS